MEASVIATRPPVRVGIPVGVPKKEEGGQKSAPVSQSSAIAVPQSAGPEYEQVVEILKMLDAAKNNLSKKVSGAIAKSEKEMKENEKIELKKRVERKLNDFRGRINKLEVKVGQLLQLSPQSRAKVSSRIQAVLKIAKNLAEIQSLSDRDFDSAAGEVGKLMGELETEVTELEKELKDDALLIMMFGPNWNKGIRIGALEDGVVKPGELTETGKAWFNKLGSIAGDGLTVKELKSLARAKKEFALFLGAAVSEKKIKAKDVESAFDKAVELAARGELTRGKLNEILKPFGVEFSEGAFAYLFTSKPDQWFHEERVAGVEGFLKRVHDLFLTIQFATGIDPVELDEFGERERSTIARTFQEYAVSESFFMIDFNKNRGIIIGALREEYAKDKLSSLDLDKLLMKLSELPGHQQELFEKISARDDLDAEQKWDLVVLSLFQQLYGHLRVNAGIKEPEKRDLDRIKNFEKMITEVQMQDEGSKVLSAYMIEFRDVIITGRKQVFDWEKVLQGDAPKGGTLAVPAQKEEVD